MSVSKSYQSYQTNSIQTAKPEELTMMLYNGLVRFIMQAQKAIDENALEKAHHSIIKAEDIIVEFQSSLNMEIELSHNLMLIYDYMYRRLVEANLRKEKVILAEVLELATDLRNTWEKAMKLAKEQAQNSKPIDSK